MEAATPLAEPTPRESDLLVCLAAIGRALHGEFQPRLFLEELSTALRPLVPHDHLDIGYLAEDRRTFSVFAEHGTLGFLPRTERYTTDLEHTARFPVADSPLAVVFDGEVLCASHLQADPRFVRHADELRAAGLQSAVFVPLMTGNRVIGELGAASRVADAYDDVHIERLRRVGHLIGPLIEMIVLIHRQRRVQHHLGLLQGITHMLGTTLHVRQILAPLGEAIRRAIDFDTLGVILLKPGTADYAFFGTVGEPPVPGVESIPTNEFSYAGAVMAGRPVLFVEASRELDPVFAGDRVMLTAGYQSFFLVPMQFGDEIGGALFFGKHEPYWYDGVDVEIATIVASRMVLGIQHQRLAEHQQRLGAVEEQAQKIERQVASLRTTLDNPFGFDAIIGRAPKFVAVVEDARKVAVTNTTVLLTGESGTGKEVLALAIHQASPRADGPFIALNCAALPETLVESELFGHERGAFTGADRLKRGRFELAGGGTLFLDEIGELTAAVQAKLLRVLQERRYERVGGTTTLKADVRLIAATNSDLERGVAEGRFREDLYYRLGVFRIHLPALRERGEDVLLLADHFVRELGAKMGKLEPGLNREARDLLLAHSWPGNIRELQNAIERALILAQGELIAAEHLGLARRPRDEAVPATAPAVTAPAVAAPPTDTATSTLIIAEQEKRLIVEALRRTGGNKTRAAAALGLSPTQLLRRIRRFGLDRQSV
jgi:transcriptional regulator with GAF, ATPase, and Fis domain